MNIVLVPRELAAECLAYDRCVKTDEHAIDKAVLGWPANGLLRRIAPSATALGFGRPLSSLLLSTPVPQGEVSTVCAVLALLLTGQIALALVPAVTYIAFRGCTLRRFWIRCKIGEGDQLELRDVSDGFKAHVDTVVAASGRAGAG